MQEILRLVQTVNGSRYTYLEISRCGEAGPQHSAEALQRVLVTIIPFFRPPASALKREHVRPLRSGGSRPPFRIVRDSTQQLPQQACQWVVQSAVGSLVRFFAGYDIHAVKCGRSYWWGGGAGGGGTRVGPSMAQERVYRRFHSGRD
jgi:hypothetical protein